MMNRKVLNRNKRSFVLQWLRSLRNSQHINWPYHKQTALWWYNLFEADNPSQSAAMFLDIKHFSRQMNIIIEMNMIPGLSRIKTSFPNYTVYYILQDTEYHNQRDEGK